MEKVLFSQMNLSDEVKNAVAEMGFEEATSIQTQSIPMIMEGKDIIGQSQTGTGKTAAFGIPAIEKIQPELSRQVQVLVLCPTRELAVQACDEMRKFAKYKQGIKAVPIYGGQPIERQIFQLKQGAQIVIGTPGRVMDHMRRRTLKLDSLSMVILDEADEMLNMGFREDIETILSEVPAERQTVLFSATMPPEIIAITKNYQRDPQLIRIPHPQLTVPTIEQFYYEAPVGRKTDVLCRIIDLYNPRLSMVFCNTKKMVDDLVGELQTRGYQAEGLHGDMKQAARTQVMDKFKARRTDILVATDVAARGIDVDDIDAVFNYDIPQDEEYYVHRIGRTGRAGKGGRAFTLVCGRRQVFVMKDIQRFTKAKIEFKALPSQSEIMESRLNKFADELRRAMEENDNSRYMGIIDQLLEEGSTLADISAALIGMLMGSRGMQKDDGLDEAALRPNSYNFESDRAESRPSSNYRRNENMVRLMINAGSAAGIAPNHVVGAIAGETGLPGRIIGSIRIFDKYTLVEVPAEHKDMVLTAMQSCKINGRMTTTVEAPRDMGQQSSYSKPRGDGNRRPYNKPYNQRQDREYRKKYDR
ncbi:DEAD/DEAH box helicase [Acetanaerobacterium elongatum]|uniref:DEAD/DEAH box helicase n=1 Tax=Acetanaerobacterium elongatum TaxID=258515 RepID=UPI000B83B8D7|nr:DEAD/DEAH box helicase [Acetanaerobacterium elongatum]